MTQDTKAEELDVASSVLFGERPRRAAAEELTLENLSHI